jgi:hypothetical protein
VVHERPFDAACMSLQRPFDRLRLEPRPHSKVASIEIADSRIVPHPYACVPEQHRPKVQRPDCIFAIRGAQMDMGLR